MSATEKDGADAKKKTAEAQDAAKKEAEGQAKQAAEEKAKKAAEETAKKEAEAAAAKAAQEAAKREPGNPAFVCTAAVFTHSAKPLGMTVKSEVSVKPPGKHEILVKVHAAAINPIDYKLLDIPLMNFFVEGKIVGRDFAGEVVKIGSAVTNLAVGDHVYGVSEGTLSAYLVADASKVAPKPKQANFEAAASLPVAAVTTYQAFKKNGVKEGTRMLVLGASGGCGLMGVQIGKSMGAHVVAVCSGKNAAIVSKLGADHVIDYTTMDLSKTLLAGGEKYFPGGEKFDIVFDTVSSADHADARYEPEVRPFIKKEGHYVALGGRVSDSLLGALQAGTGLNLQRSGYDMVLARPTREDLEAVAALVDAGKLKATVACTHPLTDEGLKMAFDLLKSRRTVGKIVMVPSHDAA